MEFVVLAKAVPALDVLEFDPVSRSVRREGAPLFLNPFDARALRVALDLRRPGDRITVLSLGPPAARAPLTEAKAAGADRVVLLSDPRCAGSDTLATATALAAAVRLLRADVILAGAWTTDSETGQLGPELAALLDWPVVSEARALRWGADGGSLEAVVDTETGWAAVRGNPPALISVDEKIAKPPKPSPEAVRALGPSAVDVWSADDLGIEAVRLGARGSRTVVLGVTTAAPTRTPEIFAEGTVAERVRAATERLAQRIGEPPPVPPRLPPAPPHRAADRELLVLASDRTGRFDRSCLGTLVALRRRLPDHWPSALWIGDVPSEEDSRRLAGAGALAGYRVPTADRPVDPGSAAIVAEELVVRRPELAAFLFGAGPFGRTVAGRLAGRRRLGLVGDAIDLAAGPRGELRWFKPSFGGRTIAEIRCTSRPELVTFRGGGFAPLEDAGPGELGWTVLSVPVAPPAWSPGEAGTELDATDGLDGRDVVVCVGLGIGGPDGIARLRPTLARWNAALAATRKVVDAGWVPRPLQVGLTGRSLAPRLAVLLGVSGAVNHAVGWRRAGTVLAINRDPGAPVFRDADVGIVGPLEDVLPALVDPVARLLGR
ncbi:MAG TPA: FAD-binding protein [Thermoplasmata archaeon]|nr:FAD-binding protein [Thermoplasmata archaeon]